MLQGVSKEVRLSLSVPWIHFSLILSTVKTDRRSRLILSRSSTHNLCVSAASFALCTCVKYTE